MANKANKNRFAPKLKIKKGDKVVVIAGAYKDEKPPEKYSKYFLRKTELLSMV